MIRAALDRLVVTATTRLVAATRWIDRGYYFFNRARSRVVLGFAGERFFRGYNDVSYGRTGLYRPDSPAFRRTLYAWEEHAIQRFFPGPPGRILVGGVGGGREAFVLADRGYSVVAFDPSARLIASMRHKLGGADDSIRVYQGEYRDLPFPGMSSGFDAAIFGWTSFSHIENDTERVEALRKVSRLTNGPILVSYFGRAEPPAVEQSAEGADRPRSQREPGVMFSVQVGRFRQLAGSELKRLASEAGLTALFIEAESEFPHAVLGRM